MNLSSTTGVFNCDPRAQRTVEKFPLTFKEKKIDCTRNNKCQHGAPLVFLSWSQKDEDAICGVH